MGPSLPGIVSVWACYPKNYSVFFSPQSIEEWPINYLITRHKPHQHTL